MCVYVRRVVGRFRTPRSDSKSHRGLSLWPFTSSMRWFSSITLSVRRTYNEHFLLLELTLAAAALTRFMSVGLFFFIQMLMKYDRYDRYKFVAVDFLSKFSSLTTDHFFHQLSFSRLLTLSALSLFTCIISWLHTHNSTIFQYIYNV